MPQTTAREINRRDSSRWSEAPARIVNDSEMQGSRETARSFAIAGRDVHVWPVRIQGSDEVAARFESFLTPAEAARAAAFRFEHLRRSFRLTRGALRLLIGGYLGVAPGKVLMNVGPNGKPGLVISGDAPPDFQFNVSHSGDLALFAFTRGCEIGADVELIRPMADLALVANQFFCREESEELLSLPAAERDRAFFLCWTRKEAYVKAVGDGLSTALDSFRVTLRPGEPARFVHLNFDSSLAQAWMLHNLEVLPEYSAALAYRAAPRPVQLRPVIGMDELSELA